MKLYEWRWNFRLKTTHHTSGGDVTANTNCCANCVEPSAMKRGPQTLDEDM